MDGEKIVQVPLLLDYAEKLEQDAKKDDRTAGRQGAYIIKAFYDGRLTWCLPGLAAAAEGAR